MAFDGKTPIVVKNPERDWVNTQLQDLDQSLNATYESIGWNGHAFCIVEAKAARLVEHATQYVSVQLANGDKVDCSLNAMLPLTGLSPLDSRAVIKDSSGLLYCRARDLKAGDKIFAPEDGGVKHAHKNLLGRTKPGSISVMKAKQRAIEPRAFYSVCVEGYGNLLHSSGILIGTL
jgi:hypothetical protein